MKRTVALIGLGVAVALLVDVMGDLTQTRPDRPVAGSQTEILLAVEVRGTRQRSPQYATESLWGACRGTVTQSLTPPGAVEVGPGRIRLVTEPALGDHAWRRLRGCLEDATVDLVKARVLSKRDLAGLPPG